MAIQSGVIPLAILLGAITSVVWFAVSREWKSSLVAGGTVAIAIMVVGILNVLFPGWHSDMLEAFTLG